jgi:hypothetical protein
MANEKDTPAPETGFVRLRGIIGPNGRIPISKSCWWDNVRRGRFPSPVNLSVIGGWHVVTHVRHAEGPHHSRLGDGGYRGNRNCSIMSGAA